MKLRNFLAAAVSAVVLLGPQLSFADPVQRGWVDFVGFDPYPGFIIGPTQTVGFRGWACVRPDLPSYGVPSTQLSVYQGGLKPPYGNGVRVTVLDVRYVVNRSDVVNAGYCANLNNGFSIWVAHNSSMPRTYYVYFDGPYESTLLGGATSF